MKIREGERLQRRLPQSCLLVAMDSTGIQFTSETFANWLDEQEQGQFVFMLGGTLGLAPQMLTQAHLCMSLSTLTFPHQLARVVLLEQLYRACRILHREPYHY